MSTPQAMPLAEALAVIHQYRADAVVITTMGAAREWQTLEPHPKDLVYMPSSMGQGPPLGLGIAIAQPDQRVIVVNGDGCTLMNLGCLVTIASQSPKISPSWWWTTASTKSPAVKPPLATLPNAQMVSP